MSSKKKSKKQNNLFLKKFFKSPQMRDIYVVILQLLRLFWLFMKSIISTSLSIFPNSIKYISKGFIKLGDLFRFSLSFKMSFMYTLMFAVIFGALNIVLFVSASFWFKNEAEKDFDKGCFEVISSFQKETDLSPINLEQFTNKYNISIQLISDDGLIEKNSKANEYPLIFKNSINFSLEDLNRSYSFKKNNLLYTFYFHKSMEIQRQILLLILLSLLLLSFLGLILSINISGILSKKLLSPIKTMTNEANSISADNLSKRLDVKRSKDELKDLTIAFNQLLNNIEESYQKQRSFVSDASHELRTPLAIIQGYADLLNRWGKKDPQILSESIEAIQSETKDMKTLVEQLLFLSRSDEKRLNLNFSLIDLSEQVEGLFIEFQRIDVSHKYSFTKNGSNFQIIADDSSIRQLLRIFLDNAKKYTPSDGNISILLNASQSNLKLIIKDSGIGIKKEDLSYIFNRFYRADKARERQGGRGLGLAIAKEIVKLHKGSISVSSEINKGTEFSISFPLAKFD